MQNKSKWLGWTIALVTMVALTEVFIWLELAPIVMLVPQSILLLNLAATLVVVLCVLALCTWMSGRLLRFSTQTLLFCVLLVGWPVSRLTHHVRKEARQVAAQRIAFSKLKELTPKQVNFGGRYNDGRHDFAVQTWLYRRVLKFVDPNEIPYEVAYLRDVDLSDTAATDEHLDLVVATGTIEVLDVSRTAVTESGIQQLAKLKSLRELRLFDVAISEETRESLKAELKQLAIHHD